MPVFNPLFHRMAVFLSTRFHSPSHSLWHCDIGTQRIIICVVEGKVGKDRDLQLSPALLEKLSKPPRIIVEPSAGLCSRRVRSGL